MPAGDPVEEIVLDSGSGISATVLSYGATLHRLLVPDRDGEIDDVLVGFDHWQCHVRSRAFFGPVVGRFANRIAGARFALDGTEYRLDRNDGANSLHGGFRGLDNRNWQVVATTADQDRASVVLRCESPAGEAGFPGRLEIEARYALAGCGLLTLELVATTDSPTVLNLTCHPLFNLAGAGRCGDVLEHRLTLVAEGFIPVDAQRIPLGRIQPVEATGFDFRRGRILGEVLGSASDEQIILAGGLDHTFATGDGSGSAPRQAAILEEPDSGRRLHIATNQPGLQVYTANELDGSLCGKRARPLVRWGGIALEPQHFPDSPNRPAFPSCRLDPGEVWRNLTTFRFETC